MYLTEIDGHYHLCSPLEDISLLNSSPALICVKPNVSTIFAHCVPFPLPGPPERVKQNILNFIKMQKINVNKGCQKQFEGFSVRYYFA